MADGDISVMPAASGGAGGAVTSVSGRTGDVVITGADVGAGAFPALRLAAQTISGTATLVGGTAALVKADTTGGAFTITLPAAPTSGDLFIFEDSAGQWSTNNLTIGLNGKTLNGSSTNPVLSQVNGTFGLVYDGAGWHSIVHPPSDVLPVMDGAAAAGVGFSYARRDHVHPTDTSRAPASGIAPSAITGTAVVTADSRLSDARTPTAHKTSHATGGSDVLSPADIGAATVAQLAVLGPDRVPANAPLFTDVNATPASVKLPTLLKPIFYPVNLYGLRSLALANFGLKIQTANAGQTVGLAIYSIVWASAGTYTATLVAQLNAAMTTASAVVVTSAVTTGAAGSGAAPATLDFTANRYIVGAMQSEITTSALLGSSFAAGWAGVGILSWTAAARSSTTDWPGSFTQASGVAISGATAVPIVELVTATGAFFL